MKVKLTISPTIQEELVTIEAKEVAPHISQLMTYIQQLDKHQATITVKKDDQIYLLEYEAIVRLYLEDKMLQVETMDDRFVSGLRLYQVKEMLPVNFLQISQSEIVQLKQLDHHKLTANGLVKLTMKNGSVTYSSRRYLKAIKERLSL